MHLSTAFFCSTIIYTCVSEVKSLATAYRNPRKLPSLQNCLRAQNGEADGFSSPIVWKWSPMGKEDDWFLVDNSLINQTAQRTWNWCRHFVLKLNLCPWARASLETEKAMQVFVVTDKMDEKLAENLCYQVADKFVEYCQDASSNLESAAIFFLIFPEEDGTWGDFVDFYDWFVDLEDAWETEAVIVAPFHPNWQFGENEDDTLSLAFEKKAPYPTISFVSARVVEQAGEAATNQIADHNTIVLVEKTPEQLQVLWEESIYNT
jgi:hypothetical protein